MSCGRVCFAARLSASTTPVRVAWASVNSVTCTCSYSRPPRRRNSAAKACAVFGGVVQVQARVGVVVDPDGDEVHLALGEGLLVVQDDLDRLGLPRAVAASADRLQEILAFHQGDPEMTLGGLPLYEGIRGQDLGAVVKQGEPGDAASLVNRLDLCDDVNRVGSAGSRRNDLQLGRLGAGEVGLGHRPLSTPELGEQAGTVEVLEEAVDGQDAQTTPDPEAHGLASARRAVEETFRCYNEPFLL